MGTRRLAVVVLLALVASLLAPVLALHVDVAEAAPSTRSRLVKPGKRLPTGAACAEAVKSKPEIRPDNAEENAFVPVDGVDYSLIPWTLDSFGMADEADTLRLRIDGNFTGTTNEIIQWGACKWGFKHNIIRAMAVAESAWRMSKVGDLDKGTPSYGILQVKAVHHPTTYPASATSTAFNIDYALGYIRACYEGHIDWLGQSFEAYGAGDFWGCLGHWFSGGWQDEGALNYVSDVKAAKKQRIWLSSRFDNWT